MSHTQEMLQTHPQQMAADRDTSIPVNELASAIDTLGQCVQTCTSCADACLGEQGVSDLVRCIRLNLDCADVCRATMAVLSRQTQTDWNLVRKQLEACVAACQVCGEECRKHADHHEHCRVCADSCNECEEACNRILSSLPV